MAKNNIRACIKRNESDDEIKERKCRKRLRGFLEFMGYKCPTNDPVILREEAVRKLNEIEKRKRKRQDSDSSDSDSVAREITKRKLVCKIKKSKGITTSRVYSLNSTLMKCFHHGSTSQQTEIPPNVKSYVKKIRGSDVETLELVFKKKLTETDVKSSQGRLLIPEKQVLRKQDILMQMVMKGEKVRVYLPSREAHYELRLTQWPMNGNGNYSLTTGWNKVVKENNLHKSTVVQLWTFQVGNTPCLLLVPVDGGNDGGDINHNTTDIGVGNDGGIFGSRRSGGVVIREPTIVETPSRRESKESSRSRKGKEKVHEF